MSLEPGSRGPVVAARLAPGLLLSMGFLNLIGQAARLLPAWPVLREWPRPEVQFRLQLGEVPYDLLQAADAILAPEAVTLLVTPGLDVRGLEYTTFHRALYFLSPRPVWWLTPAPPDLTWESRWWISAPFTAEAVLTVAAEKGAPCILVSDPALELPVGIRVAAWQQGYLLELGGSGQCLRDSPQAGGADGFAGPLWPLQLATALAVIFLTGHALLAAIYSGTTDPSGIERAAQTWAFGAGAVSLLTLYLNAAGLSLEQQKIVLATLAGVWGVIALARRTKLRRPLPTSSSVALPQSAPILRRTLLWALTLLLIIQSGLVIVSALGRPLYVWDSWVNWGVKARTIFLEGHISPAVYADPSRAVTLPDYPLHVPLLEAWLYGWLGAPDDRFAGLITP